MRFLTVWALSLLSMLSAVVFLYHLAGESRIPTGQSLKGDLIFIGSSLTRTAVPPFGNRKCEAFGGLKISRYALSGIEEREALDLLALAIQARPKQVFLEINPFVIRFDSESKNILGLGSFYNSVRARIGRAANRLVAMKSETLLDDDWPKNASFEMSEVDLERIYPYTLKDPENIHRFHSLIRTARDNNVDLVLVSYPRAQSAADFLGEPLLKQTIDHMDAVARNLDLPIYVADSSWPDRYYYDQAHFNNNGRDRYAMEFENKFGICL